MKKASYLLFIFIILLIPLTTVSAHYKPSVIKNKEDLVYFIRYYNGSQSKIGEKTIKLEKDLELNDISIKFYLEKDLIFDLNGHKIISTGNRPCIIVNGDRKILTIKDSKENKGYLKSNYNTIKMSSGNLILDSVNIISTSENHNGIYITGGKTKLVDNKITSKGTAISLNYGYLQTENGTAYGNKYGLKIDNGKAIVNGGNFKGQEAGLKLNNYRSLHLKNANFQTVEETKTKEIKKVSIPKKMINNLIIIRFVRYI